MKKICLKISLASALLSSLFSIGLHAQNPASYTLPNGKVLENPYVISQKPDGVLVGHKYGAIFVKFADLPVDMQKKFNYDPKVAAEYQRQEAGAKALQEKKKAEDASRKAEEKKLYQVRIHNWKIDQLDTEIKKTELRIIFLNGEIPRLEKECGDLMQQQTALAGTSVSGGSTNYGYSYDGGFISSTGSQRAENTKRKVITGISDDYYIAKKKLNSCQVELQQKQDDIITMKKEYDQMKQGK